MPNIEINTAQNVTIQYELAGLKDRILAFLLDMLILGAGFLILLGISAIMPGIARDIMLYAVAVPAIVFYSLVSEIVGNGQSIGKAALSIKVVKITGKHATLSDYLLRWCFRFIDIWMSLGSIASMLISSSSKAQRMGDMLANTAIIKAKPSINMSLHDLLNISSIDTYQPQFPEIRKMTEEDMLLVKTVIERVKKYPNAAHLEALDMMVKHMMHQLQIPSVPVNKTEFLRTLLRDYIVLTR